MISKLPSPIKLDHLLIEFVEPNAKRYKAIIWLRNQFNAPKLKIAVLESERIDAILIHAIAAYQEGQNGNAGEYACRVLNISTEVI